MGKKFTIIHDRPNCISCGACEAVAPKFWKMSEEDGKSDIVGGKRLENGWEELDIDEANFEENKEAAECCPVNVIHLKDEDGKEII